MRFAISPSALDRAAVVASVASDAAGAIVTFEGTVRRQSRGREVVRLEYEAYAPMALAVFASIAADAQSRWPQVSLAIHHRVGVCGIGEASIIIVAVSPHRAEAFDACRLAIERLKTDAPIWKREIYTDGAEWIGQGS